MKKNQSKQQAETIKKLREKAAKNPHLKTEIENKIKQIGKAIKK